MNLRGMKDMGRFAVEFEVANNYDLAQVQGGHLKPNQVRRARIKGIVDTGATHLVIPKKIADLLGTRKSQKVRVRYADQSDGMRDVVEQVHVSINERNGVFNAIVEPKRKTALIGAIILEAFDLLPDCTHQRLIPRDPRYIIAEIE